MQIEINEQTVDRQLVDAGMKSDYEEQAVRLLLFHLFCAIRYYRDMTYAEKVKAGFLYRKKFKNDYSLTGFLKERKRKREKKNSPLHPSYKERETEVKEKEEKTHTHFTRVADLDLEERKKRFLAECQSFGNQYDHKEINKFFTYWSMKGRKGGKMRFEREAYWDTAGCMERWMNNNIAATDEKAMLQLEKTKERAMKAKNTADQQAIAAKREEDNARLEREIAERKQGAVSYEEYLKMKAAIKREQNQACLGFAEREQARCETSKVKSEK